MAGLLKPLPPPIRQRPQPQPDGAALPGHVSGTDVEHEDGHLNETASHPGVGTTAVSEVQRSDEPSIPKSEEKRAGGNSSPHMPCSKVESQMPANGNGHIAEPAMGYDRTLTGSVNGFESNSTPATAWLGHVENGGHGHENGAGARRRSASAATATSTSSRANSLTSITSRQKSWFRKRSTSRETISSSEEELARRRTSGSSVESRESVERSPNGLRRQNSMFQSLTGLRGNMKRSSTLGNFGGERKKSEERDPLENHALLDATTLEEALQITYKMSVLLPGGHLHRRIKQMERAMARESTVNILRSSRPLVCALSKRWFQLLLFLYCFGHFYIAISAVIQAASHKVQRFNHFRFTALEQRSSPLSPDQTIVTAHISALGLLRDGCRVEAEEEPEARFGGAEVTLRFGEAVPMNGFYFSTHSAEPEKDPVRFRLHAKTNRSSDEWEEVAASGYDVMSSGKVVFKDERFPTPLGRNEVVKVQTRARWPWYIGWGAAPLGVASCVLVAGVLGALEKEKSGERSFQLGWFVGSLLRFITLLGFMALGDWTEVCYFVLHTGGSIGVLLASFTAGRWFVRALVIVGGYLCLVELISVAVLRRHHDASWEHAVPFLGISMVFVGFCFKLLRLSIKSGARLHIQDDKRAFENAWSQGLEEGDNVQFDLYKLERSIQDENKKIAYRLARQYNSLDENVRGEDPDPTTGKRGFQVLAKSRSGRSLTEGPGAGQGREGVKAVLRKSNSEVQLKKSASTRGFFGLIHSQHRGRLLDFRNPVRSLDQLYTEAYGANIMLRAKAQDWALHSQGMFAVGLGAGDSYAVRKSRTFYVKWSEILQDADMKGRVQWTKLKQVDRAIEKAMLCYNSDVSRLLDISRQRIVFDRIQDLETCFQRIAQDQEISLCRIKNYMGAGYVHKRSAGFRAVIINLRICTRAAMDLGLDTHVCELQLVMTKMVQLQTREQHVRYIRWRNDLTKSYVREPLRDRVMKLVTCNWIKEARLPFYHRGQKNSSKSTQAKRKANLAQVHPHQHNPMLIERQESFVQKRGESNGEAATVTDTQRQLHDMMAPAYKINCTTAGDELHSQIQVVNDAMQHANRIGVAFTSKAAAAMLSKRMWQSGLFLVASLALVWSVLNTIRAFEPSYLSYQEYRFTVLEQRSGTSGRDRAEPTAHISALGLLRDGCRVTSGAASETRAGAQVTVRYDKEVPMNGFYFVTHGGEPDKDPVRFWLHARTGNGEWETVSASSWRIRATGFVDFNDGRFPTPRARNQRVDVYPRAGWPWVVAFPGVQFVVLTISFTLVACGALGRARHAEWLLIAGFTAVAILQVLGASGEIGQGRREEGAYWLLFALAPLAMALMIAVDEKHIIARMTAAGAYLCLLELVFAAAVWQELSELTMSPPLTGLLFFLAGGSLLGAHAMALWRAKRLIQEDKAKYDKVWERELADPQTKQEIDKFAESVKQVTKRIGKGWARQMGLKEAEFLSVSLLSRYDKAYAQNADTKYIGWTPHLSRQKAYKSFRIKKRFLLMRALTSNWKTSLPNMPDCPSVYVDVQTKIVSLDQLYMQAHCMDVVLKAKVQEWALKADGWFPLTRQNGKPCAVPTFAKWSDLKQQHNPAVKWGKVKSVSRSIEKLLRVYQADVSKLVDVCRQSIVFNSMTDLARGFDVVVGDPHVDVLRVVNRLDVEYDARESAGYRDVKLNIRINTKEAVELYINSHVCELQLIHMDFATLKHDAGHQRYKLFRDERCE